jgi:hypothetical protein
MSKRAKIALQAAAAYLVAHPDEALRILRNALALRVGVPLQALRWFADRSNGRRAPKDVRIEARPPGLYLAASFELMGTPLRASGVVFVESVELGVDSLRVELRLDQVELQVLSDEADTPIAALLRSGALDLSRPGNLAAFMPKRPPMLVGAEDDRIVLDLFRHPKLRGDVARRLIGVITPMLGVRSVAADGEHVDVALEAFPAGLSEAWHAVRKVL